MKAYINAVLIIIGLSFLIEYGARIYIESSFVPEGPKLQEMQQEAHDLEIQNMELKAELYHEEALTTIASKAAAMGFVDVGNNVVYITK